jgi:hypothetical protein
MKLIDELCGKFSCAKAGDDAREQDSGGTHWQEFEYLISIG